MSHELNVSLSRKGGVIDLDMESGALGCVHIDSEKLSADERAGTAKKLLAASAPAIARPWTRRWMPAMPSMTRSKARRPWRPALTTRGVVALPPSVWM